MMTTAITTGGLICVFIRLTPESVLLGDPVQIGAVRLRPGRLEILGVAVVGHVAGGGSAIGFGMAVGQHEVARPGMPRGNSLRDIGLLAAGPAGCAGTAEAVFSGNE